VNDCFGFGTNRKPNAKYEVDDKYPGCQRFIHAYNGDSENQRTVPARMWIVAKRDIEGGEEITASYGAGYWKRFSHLLVNGSSKKRRRSTTDTLCEPDDIPSSIFLPKHLPNPKRQKDKGIPTEQLGGIVTRQLYTDRGVFGKGVSSLPVVCAAGSPRDFSKLLAVQARKVASTKSRVVKRPHISSTDPDGFDMQDKRKRSARYTLLDQATLEIVPVQDFSQEAVRTVFEVFDNLKGEPGHVVVMSLHKLHSTTTLSTCCEALVKANHSFRSHTSARVSLAEIQKDQGHCRLRVEHNLHDVPLRRCRGGVYSRPLSTLVDEHFKGSAFKEAWDMVASIIQERWPKRKPRHVLMATGDCRKLSAAESIGNVQYTAGGQLVKCHWDGYHVVCFVVKGRKDFRVSPQAAIQAPQRAKNLNEAHHINAMDRQFAHLFRAAEIPADHVLFMEFQTWHEVFVETPVQC